MAAFSLTDLMTRPWWRVKLVTKNGGFVILRRVIYWKTYILFKFVFLAEPKSCNL